MGFAADFWAAGKHGIGRNFRATTFCGHNPAYAALMFTVEFMFAKMVLPRLGGSPSVWNTCLVFYQAALMAGYIYAHFSMKWLGPRRQSLLHIVLLCLAWIVLPIGSGPGLGAAEREQPHSLALDAVDGLRGAAVFLHFGQRAVAAGLVRPMRRAVGERSLFSLRGQQSWQPCRFGGLSAADRAAPDTPLADAMVVRRLRAAHGPFRALRGGGVDRREARGGGAQPAAPTAAEDAAPRGIGFVTDGFDAPITLPPPPLVAGAGAVPSALLMGVTTHLSVDMPSLPLLWAIPLGLYLLSFIVVFARWPILKWLWLVRIFQAAGIAAAAATIYVGGLQTDDIVERRRLHLAAFFLTAVVCHGAMAADRPASKHLTEYYLWMSAGGVAGGLLCALVAPLVFNSVLEYPLMLIGACLLCPRPLSSHYEQFWRRRLWWLALALVPSALLTGVTAYFFTKRIAAVAVGRPAGAVFPLVDRSFRLPADGEALANADPSGRGNRRCDGHDLFPDSSQAADSGHCGRSRDPVGGLFCHRAGISRGDGRRPPGKQAPHRILPLPVGGRDRRRPDLRATDAPTGLQQRRRNTR